MPQSPRFILAFDTALPACAVAVCDMKTGEAQSVTEPMAHGQAAALVPLIRQQVEKAGAEFSDIDLIVTTRGPGAFTGLRVGLATARSLALALDAAAIGVTTPEALARQYLRDHTLATGQELGCLIDTKRGDYYAQFFNSEGAALCEAQVTGPEELAAYSAGKDLVLIGDGAAPFEHYKAGYEFIDPAALAACGAEKVAGLSGNDPYDSLVPLYLRPPEVSRSKKKHRFIA